MIANEDNDFQIKMLKAGFMMTGNPLTYIYLCDRRDELSAMQNRER